MARIRDFAVTEQGGTTSTTLVCNMPEHASGDVLIYFASKDGTPVINATAGWTNIQNGTTAGCAYRCMFKSAASSGETLTVDTGTAENWTVVVVAVEGADGSSLSNLIADSGGATAESAADDTAMPFAGPSDTTNADTNCLVFHAWFSDSGLSPTAYAPLTNVYAGDNGANSVGVAYTYQRAAGSIPAASWFGRANDDGRGIVLAIKDSSSDALVPPYSDSAVSVGQVVRAMVGLATTESDSWPASLTLAMIGDDFDHVQRDVAGAFVDYTAATNNTTAADVTFPAGVGGIMYFGGDEKFQSVIVNVSTAGVGGVLAWEYHNGSTWVSTGVTGSNLTATGLSLITLSTAAVGLMTQQTINSVTKYWVRARVTTGYGTTIVCTQGRKGGRTATYSAAAASADNGTNPYTDGTSHTGSTVATTLSGFEHQYGAALDLDTGILYGSFRGALRRDLDIDPSFPHPVADPGGLQVTFLDASVNYASYIIQARGAKDVSADDRNVFAIDWNGAATPWAVRGAISKSAVTRSIWTSLGQAGAVSRVYSMMSLVTRLSVAGGSSTDPLDFDDVEYVVNNSCGLFPFIRRAGAAATIYVPVQFGGGDKLCLSIDKITFQFPRRYDGVDYFTWNAGDNVAGVKFYPKTDDVLIFTNCLFTSPSAYRWEFDASMASSGFTMDFAGTTVVGATVTLRSAVTLESVSFIDCPSFTQNNAVLDSCTFDGTKVTSDNPADISSSSFVAGTTHGIEITAPGTYTFDANTFTGFGPDKQTFHTTTDVNATTDVVTTDTEHGYVDGSPVFYQKMGGSVNVGLTDGTIYYVRAVSTTELSFHTSASNAQFDILRIALTSTGSETHHIYSATAGVYNNSGGAVTLNVTGGGSTPSVRNANAAANTTTVNNNRSVTLTGLKDSTEVRVYTSGTQTELAGTESATDGSADNRSFTFSVASGSIVDIVVHKITYEHLRISSLTVTSDSSIPISQRFDRNYSNP